jgi:hypothetical protein
MTAPAPRSARGRLKEIYVEWEMFNFAVFCVIGPHEDLANYIPYRHKRSYDAPTNPDISGLYFSALPKCDGILWLAKSPRRPAQIGYLAHEMGHAVLNLVQRAGIRVNSKTEETICYAIGHGIEQVLKGVRK